MASHITIIQDGDTYGAELAGASHRVEGAASAEEAIGRLVLLLSRPLQIEIRREQAAESSAAREEGDHWSRAWDAAHDRELAVLEAIGIRARIIWRCPCGCLNREANTACEECGAPAGD